MGECVRGQGETRDAPSDCLACCRSLSVSMHNGSRSCCPTRRATMTARHISLHLRHEPATTE
jgi:hypothetical protein